MDKTPSQDDLSADFAVLDALRQSVRKNLVLRPIRRESSTGSSSTQSTNSGTGTPQLVPSSRHSLEISYGPLSPTTPASAYFTPIGIHDSFPGESPISRLSPHEARATDPETLYGRLLSRRRPLLIDTRAPASHAAFQILHSINIAIPPPLLQRIISRKDDPIRSIAGLRHFITTDASRASWDKLMRVDSDTWDGDVILYDDEPGSGSARALIPVIEPLLNGDGSVDWLEGGISFASRHPGLQTLVVSGDETEIASARPIDNDEGRGGRGGGRGRSLLSLDIPGIPQIDFTSPSTAGGSAGISAARGVKTPSTATTPIMPGAMPKTGQAWMSTGRDTRFLNDTARPSSPPLPGSAGAKLDYSHLQDPTPSPPPSHTSMQSLQSSRKLSLGNLKKIDVGGMSLRSKKSKEKFNGLKLDIDSTIDNSKPSLPTTFGIPSRPPQYDDDGITAASPGPMRSVDIIRAKKSLDRLPKLQIAPPPLVSQPLLSAGAKPSSSLALPIPASKARSRSPSPGRLNLKHSNFNSSTTGGGGGGGGRRPIGLVLDAAGISPPAPLTPRADLPPSPSTAKPETNNFGYPPMSTVEVNVPPLPSGLGWGGGRVLDSAGRSRFGAHHATSSISSNASGSSTHEEDALPEFLISMILPGFLYLGPEPSEDDHVDEMKSLGIKRILNIAFECNPTDYGLSLQDTFEKYIKIPMRDTVEEDRVRDGIKVVCEVLDDARLHSAPVYVHCKAGKSRSVTAVIAYLIHANHWTLSRAYSFVLERRRGISPNIGFVSELMNFEERELGGKSVGVQKSAGAQPSDATSAGAGPVGNPHRRGAHVRESLPPAFFVNTAGDAPSGPVSAIDAAHLKLMGLGEEMEMRDAGGRYRHARRAPVDEQTLQPMRRVSKAGLESIGFMGYSSDSDESDRGGSRIGRSESALAG